MIGLVTAAGARDLDTDLPLLLAELPEAEPVVWDDPGVDWARYATVVIGSAWDYVDRRDEFVAWAHRVGATTSLWNRAGLVEWNTDKRYLVELGERGVPVVPTTVIPDSDGGAPPAGLTGDVVVKPAVGAGSRGAARFRDDPDAAWRHARSLAAGGVAVIAQPYLAAIDEHGETGLVYLAGRYSHAFRKAAILDGEIEWEGGLYAKEAIEPRVPTAAELALGARVLDTLPPTAYARVDVVGTDGGPVLLELELAEPSLFLHVDPQAPARAAAAFRSLGP